MTEDYGLNDRLEVYWIDAVDQSKWQSPEEAGKRPDDTDTLTLGYFLKKDDEFLYVSWSAGPKKDSERTVTTIPLGCIKEVRILGFCT